MSRWRLFNIRATTVAAVVLAAAAFSVATAQPIVGAMLSRWISRPKLPITTFDARSQRAMWPRIYGGVGPYQVRTEEELAAVAKAGFRFALLADAVAFSRGVSRHNISYLDTYANWRMYTLCHAEILRTGACSIGTQNRIVQGVAERLDRTVNAKNVVGYYILDDNPGADIRPLLKRIHTWIAQQNKRSDFARAAVCAFGSIASTVNFDGEACDIVAVYLYAGVGASPSGALRQNLPPLLEALRNHGWNQKQTPLIGIVQTFGDYEGQSYALPSTDDVREEAVTYCAAGAIALLAYTWHDGFNGRATQLRNSPTMVSGLQQGANICRRKYWN